MGLFSGLSDLFSPVKELAGALSPVGDLFSLGSSAFSLYNSASGAGLRDQKDLMSFQAELQDRYWTKQYGQRHQLEVDDLKKAGLNPILSANSAGGVAGVSANASPNETRSQKLATSAALANAFSQSRMTDSMTLKNAADASLSNALQYKANTEAGLMDFYARLAEQKNNAEISLLAAQAFNAHHYPPNLPTWGKNLEYLFSLPSKVKFNGRVSGGD
ncbi:DNA pilot protein [Dipodfec virus UOA04_Rod_1082]|nr:DNA pilot protein [Dipodfec virus UOA04_Rod_1082]